MVISVEIDLTGEQGDVRFKLLCQLLVLQSMVFHLEM